MSDNIKIIDKYRLNDILHGEEDKEYELVATEHVETSDYFTVNRIVIIDITNRSYWAAFYERSHQDDCNITWCNTEGPEVELYEVFPKVVSHVVYVDTAPEDVPEWEQGVYPE